MTLSSPSPPPPTLLRRTSSRRWLLRLLRVRPRCCLPRHPLLLLAVLLLPSALCLFLLLALASSIDLGLILEGGVSFGGGDRGTGSKVYYSAVCNSSFPTSETESDSKLSLLPFKPDLPIIYFVTPTFTRREQLPELLRLGQTLLHVSNLVWLVAEDRPDCSSLVGRVLKQWSETSTYRSKLPEGTRRPFVHLLSPMPSAYKSFTNKPRGVSNRNAALRWIEENHGKRIGGEGVVYFADDDNTYDLKLFDEIRWTSKVSMFPVGLVGKQGISAPVVRGGRVVGFTDPWIHKRKFPVDMAGFAFNVKLLVETKARMPFVVGMEEDQFLRALKTEYDDLEPLAKNCTEVLVWHTQTERAATTRSGRRGTLPLVRRPHLAGSNLPALAKQLQAAGVLELDEEARNSFPVCMQERCH